MSAAEYLASVADVFPIGDVEKELDTVNQSPSVKSVTEFWSEFWQEISKRYK